MMRFKVVLRRADETLRVTVEADSATEAHDRAHELVEGDGWLTANVIESKPMDVRRVVPLEEVMSVLWTDWRTWKESA